METAREAVRRRKLLQFLGTEEPGWNDRDHPELELGSAAWVRKLRSENEKRSGKTQRQANLRRTKPRTTKR